MHGVGRVGRHCMLLVLMACSVGSNRNGRETHPSATAEPLTLPFLVLSPFYLNSFSIFIIQWIWSLLKKNTKQELSWQSIGAAAVVDLSVPEVTIVSI
jgi:hypothetical protein